MTTGNLYIAGQNQEYQENFSDVATSKILGVYGGYGKIVILFENGKIQNVGLGTELQKTEDLEDDTIGISIGQDHWLCCTKSGKAFASGKNKFGQLGLGHFRDSKTLAKVTKLKNVIKVACGARHSLALVEGGSVYSWGDGSYGQLGHKTREVCNGPRFIVHLPQKLTDIACGAFFSLGISESGMLYCWGDACNYQIGVRATSINVPTLVELPVKITKAVAGFGHVMALSNDRKEIYSWGNNKLGMCGQGEKNTKTVSVPTKVKGLPKDSVIKDIDCGSFYNGILLDDGRVFSYGLQMMNRLVSRDDGEASSREKFAFSGVPMLFPHPRTVSYIGLCNRVMVLASTTNITEVSPKIISANGTTLNIYGNGIYRMNQQEEKTSTMCKSRVNYLLELDSTESEQKSNLEYSSRATVATGSVSTRSPKFDFEDSTMTKQMKVSISTDGHFFTNWLPVTVYREPTCKWEIIPRSGPNNARTEVTLRPIITEKEESEILPASLEYDNAMVMLQTTGCDWPIQIKGKFNTSDSSLTATIPIPGQTSVESAALDVQISLDGTNFAYTGSTYSFYKLKTNEIFPDLILCHNEEPLEVKVGVSGFVATDEGIKLRLDDQEIEARYKSKSLEEIEKRTSILEEEFRKAQSERELSRNAKIEERDKLTKETLEQMQAGQKKLKGDALEEAKKAVEKLIEDNKIEDEEDEKRWTEMEAQKRSQEIVPLEIEQDTGWGNFYFYLPRVKQDGSYLLDACANGQNWEELCSLFITEPKAEFEPKSADIGTEEDIEIEFEISGFEQPPKMEEMTITYKKILEDPEAEEQTKLELTEKTSGVFKSTLPKQDADCQFAFTITALGCNCAVSGGVFNFSKLEVPSEQ